MFYFKITTRSKRGRDQRTSRNTYHEFTKPAYAGEFASGQLTRRDVTSVGVTKISQRAYIAATRPKD